MVSRTTQSLMLMPPLYSGRLPGWRGSFCVLVFCRRTTARLYEDAHHSVWCLLLQLGKKGLFANGRWSKTPLFALALCNHTLSGWRETGPVNRAQNGKGQRATPREKKKQERDGLACGSLVSHCWLCHRQPCRVMRSAEAWRDSGGEVQAW